MIKFNYFKKIHLGICLSLTAASLFAQNTMAYSANDYGRFYQDLWALKNTGKAQVFDLNPLQSYQMQGRVGADMSLLPRVLSPINGKKIKVAVVDTGVDISHPYLKNRIAYNQKECEILSKYKACLTENSADGKACIDQYLALGKNGTDADSNGYPADCAGWSTLSTDKTPDNILGTPDFEDTVGHGTHVAGLIAAVSDNIEIIPVQVDSDGPNEPVKPMSLDLSPSENSRGGVRNGATQTAEHVARGIIYAVHAGADVINISLGWPQTNDSELMRVAIAAAQQKGIIIVAAAGNDSTQALLRPCQYKGVICVAATRPDGSIAHFSNYGYGVDIAAPGASIASVIPMNRRSIRIPGYSGIDILSGTSQASPLVAGVVADLLSRGIPANEIYARLILGASALQSELPVLIGPKNGKTRAVKVVSNYRKYVLSGLINQAKAFNVQAQPLILKADKEVSIINWDRKSKNLKFRFNLKNYWKGIPANQVALKIENKINSHIYPQISGYSILDLNKSAVWSSGQERTVEIQLAIVDTQEASLSRIPSELSFKITPYLNGQPSLTFEARADVLFKATQDMLGQDLKSITISGKLEEGMSLYLVDEVYDSKQHERDYFAIRQGQNAFDIQLVRFEQGQYVLGQKQSFTFNGNIDLTVPAQRVRMDIDGDGLSEYVFILREFKTLQERHMGNGDHRIYFYIFDQNMNLKKQASFYDERSLVPVQFYWLKVGKSLRPAWVGQGQGVVTKSWDITQLWQTEDESKPDYGASDIRLYFLDENFKLSNVEAPVDSRIVEVIQPTVNQVKAGVLPVLVARNTGTEVKPSYIYNFSLGYIKDLKVVDERPLQNMSVAKNYRNLLDTRTDKNLNLRSSSDEFRGTYWFGLDAHQKQRVTMIDYNQGKIYDRVIGSMNTVYDSALLVRSAYMGSTTQGVFVITNTEIEYHDFRTSSFAQTSLNKYTYMGDDLTVVLQYPITVNRKRSSEKYPALYTMTGQGLDRGIRVIVPVLNSQGKISEIVTPARLRIQNPQGCKPLDTPVYLGADGVDSGYAMDFYCGNKIMRFNLSY